MNSLLPLQTISTDRQKPQFNSVVVYEDVATKTRAQNIYKKLACAFGEDLEFCHSSWEFPTLESENTRRQAINEAAKAHLVILSFVGNAELSDFIKTWLECWVQRSATRGAVLIMLSDPQASLAHITRTRFYLHQVTKGSHVIFFPHYSSRLIRRIYE